MSKSSTNLSKHIVACIVDTAKRYPEIEEVILFGSWALGNAKRGSDIDLALSGRKIGSKVVASFHSYMEEETTIPHFFDVIHLEKIESNSLRQHILEKGITLYSASDHGSSE